MGSNAPLEKMLPNEKFALDCLAYYEAEGFIVDASNGEFAHCPLPKKEGEKGYYLLHDHHMHQGLLQSRDLGKKCFFPYHTKKWLLTADYWPDDYFGLWDVYDFFMKKCAEGMNAILHSEKNEEGKSVRAIENIKRLHANKDENGKSLHAVKIGKASHRERNEEGKSVRAIEHNNRINAEKDENGKSLCAMKNLHTSRFRCLLTGYVTTCGPLARYQRARNIDTTLREKVEWDEDAQDWTPVR